MCHRGAIQHRSSWQVPDPNTQKCRKTRTCGVRRDLPSSINQLRQTRQLGPHPDPGGMDQDRAKGMEGYLNWPFQCPRKVLEREPLKQVKLHQPQLQGQKSNCQLFGKQDCGFSCCKTCCTGSNPSQPNWHLQRSGRPDGYIKGSCRRQMHEMLKTVAMQGPHKEMHHLPDDIQGSAD